MFSTKNVRGWFHTISSHWFWESFHKHTGDEQNTWLDEVDISVIRLVNNRSSCKTAGYGLGNKNTINHTKGVLPKWRGGTMPLCRNTLTFLQSTVTVWEFNWSIILIKKLWRFTSGTEWVGFTVVQLSWKSFLESRFFPTPRDDSDNSERCWKPFHDTYQHRF